MAGQDDFVISIIMQAVDKATGPITQLNKAVGGLKSAVVGLLGAWSLHKIIEVTERSQESVVQLDVAFRNMGATAGVTRAEIDAMIQSIGDNSNLTKSSMREAAAMMLRFKSVTGETFKRAIDLSAEMAEAMGTEAPQAARRLGRALEDPAGSLGLLARAGVKFTQAEEDAIKKFSEMNRVGDAQTIMLMALEQRYKGVGAALRNTLGGAIKGVQKAFSEMMVMKAGTTEPAVRALNELTKALQDPKLRQAIQDTMAALVDLSAVLIKLGADATSAFAKMAEQDIKDIDKVGVALADMTLKLAAYIEMRDKLNPGAGAYITIGGLRDLAEWFDPKAKPRIAGPTSRPVVTEGQKAANAEKARLEAEAASLKTAEELKKLAETRSKALQGILQIVNGWKESEKAVGDALAQGAITAAEAAQSLAALREAIRSEVLPEDATFGEQFVAKMDKVIAALDHGAASAKEAGDAILRLREDALAEVGPAWLKEVIAWDQAERKLKAVAEAIHMDAAQIAKARAELAEQYLPEIKVTATRIILPKMQEEVSEFAKEAARNIQDAFADAFLHVGRGWKETLHNLWMSFASLLANMAAKNLMEAMGIEDVVKGTGKGKGPIADILDAVFGTKKKNPASDPVVAAYEKVLAQTTGPISPVMPKSSGGLDEVVVRATRVNPIPVEVVSQPQYDGGIDSRNPIPEVKMPESVVTQGMRVMWTEPMPVNVMNWPVMPDPCKCVTDAIETATSTVIDNTGGADIATADAVTEGTQSIMAKIIGVIQKMIGAMGQMFKSVVSGINNLMIGVMHVLHRIAKGSGGGSNMGGMVVQAVATYYGGGSWAKGGYIPAQRAGGGAIVGEEGPELFLPGMSGTIFNNRQLAFVGAGKGGGVEYKPTYNITINGSRDDKQTLAALREYISRKDADTEARMRETLRRNGMGRMRR